MRQEFGKWFLDVAKYLLTALILTYFFDTMSNGWVVVSAITMFVVCILLGIFLLRKGEETDGKDVRSIRDDNLRSNSRPVGRKRRRKTKPETTKPTEIVNNE